MILHRYSQEQTVVYGCTISGRQAEVSGIETQVGLFINTISIVTHFNATESGEAYLKSFHQNFQEAQHYGYVPLWEIQKQSGFLSKASLFHYLFVFENYPLEGVKESEAIFKELGFRITDILSEERTHYPLTVMALEHHQGIQFKLDYMASHFDEGDLSQLCRHWQKLLQELITRSDEPYENYHFLEEKEAKQILVEWNQTEQAYPKDQTLPQLFEAQAQKTPDNIAVIFENQQLTYQELNEQANQLAHYLIQQGIRPESKVAIMMERSIELIIGILGILKAGGAYVPLDPSYPEERLSYMLEDSEAEILLTMSSFESVKFLISYQIKILFYDSVSKALSLESKEIPTIDLSADNLAYIIYTSGSTGKPKGVQISHRSICDHIYWYGWYRPDAEGERFFTSIFIWF